MKQSGLSKVTALSTFFVVLTLVLAACSPAAPSAAPTAVIPVTGSTSTPMAPTAAPAAFTVMVKNDPKLGDFLVDAKGMTLYLFTKDTVGASNCSGGCLAKWPALIANGALTAGPGVAGKLDVITRADNSAKQVTYNGYPLYYWINDKAPGDTTGQGVGGVWFVVPPTATTTLPTAMPAPAAFTVMVKNDPKLGDFLVDAKGMTLYLFTKDTVGASNCSGGCLAKWPALIANGALTAGPGVAGKLDVITRADNSAKQVTYNGYPLYYWINDKAAGDTTGQGVGGVWFVVPPTATTTLPTAMPAPAAFTVMVKNDPKLGDFLVDAKGMTLYLFTKDTVGASNCSGGCLKAWPALIANGALTAGPGVAGKLDVITRADDGTKQVTYNGYPLYYWKNDKAAGDITGQGVGGVWFVVPPTATTTLPAAPVVMVKNDPKLGDYLVDAKGMTLYMFTKDTAGVSNCSGGCLKAWPPLVATGDLTAGPGVTGKLGFITRTDGTKQVTYNDMPLYYWASDMKPGDMTGQGVGGVWYMLSPTAPIK